MDLFGSIGSTLLGGSSELDILGIADTGGDFLSGSSGFPDVGDFLGGLGDTVGPASSLLGLAQKASGALSGVLGGGGGGGSGESKGFVPQTNKALSAAEQFQVGQALRQTSERERSEKGREGNPHSVAIVRELLRQKPDGVKAAGNALMSVALKSGSRAELRARASA